MIDMESWGFMFVWQQLTIFDQALITAYKISASPVGPCDQSYFVVANSLHMCAFVCAYICTHVSGKRLQNKQTIK